MDPFVAVLGLACLVLLGAAIYGATVGVQALSQRRDSATATEIGAAELSEDWAIWFISRYPTLGDDEIATLMRDELVNRRIATPANLRWAHPATVGRVRRTMVRSVVERDR